MRLNTKVPARTTATTPFLHSSDEGWRHFQGHCYLVVTEEKTLDNALISCENKDSYLVEITTDSERDFAIDLLHGFRINYVFWIGATDKGEEGTHYENTPIQYTVIFHGCKNDNFRLILFYYFLIFAQNIDCGYTEAVLTSTHTLCFRAKIRK